MEAGRGWRIEEWRGGRGGREGGVREGQEAQWPQPQLSSFTGSHLPFQPLHVGRQIQNLEHV